MKTDQTRALSAIRLSVETDETTSPSRQRAANENAAASIGAEIIGEAVDLGVSASKTTPFERPELGSWLTRPEEFDAVLFWRFDRAVRSMADMNALVTWARKHRKVIVFAEGPGGRLVLDFRNGVDLITQLILQIFAFAAEFEAQSIRERVLGAQAAMRGMELRWRGSRPPYGYAPVPLEGGGWTLTPATEAIEGCGPAPVAVIERIIQGLMGDPSEGVTGKTVTAIAEELNAGGIPSPRDWWSLVKGRKTGGKTGGAKGQRVSRERFKWTPPVISKLLRSPALLGWKVHDGNPVRDSEGKPVMATAEPLLTRAEYDRVGALLDSRRINNRERKDTNALLLAVIHCASCGGRMYLNAQDGKTPTYKCNSSARGDSCEAPVNVRGDWADEYVSRDFLRMAGALEVTLSRVIPGYDPQPEIDATLAEYEAHRAERGQQKSKAAQASWQKHMDALDARLAELETLEKVEPRTEEISTGKTYADLWEEADTAKKRRMLLKAGAHLTVKRGTRGGWRKLDEGRMIFDVSTHFFVEAANELTAMAAELAVAV
ncbi:recombinase family protein [Streptomyces sp. NBC_01016]|uniref:recombinase family protein n=1 Tax=Streptomyces sp. NBC_01016 TaxID=2903720 RepID=UPI00225220BA|nr:recombinase family protein [Streptomyces sp. NBC_01016]MCX4831190.1 recombinase family protein [Streptomyces sp. NBC_01016]